MPDFKNAPSAAASPRALPPLVMPQDHGPVIEQPLRQHVHLMPDIAVHQDALRTAGIFDSCSPPPNLGAIEFESSDDEAPAGDWHGCAQTFNPWISHPLVYADSDEEEAFEVQLMGIANMTVAAAPASAGPQDAHMG